MDKRKAYEEKISAEFDDLKGSFEKFKAGLKSKSADAKIRYSGRDMEDKKNALHDKIAELKNAGQDKWIDLKNNIDDLMRDMRDGMRKMTS